VTIAFQKSTRRRRDAGILSSMHAVYAADFLQKIYSAAGRAIKLEGEKRI
jgi:hypothetical protein